MAHVWWHCNGVGKVEYRAQVDMPFYKYGMSTYNWHPPHDMSRKEALRIDKQLEALRQKQLALIAKATGGKVYGDGSMHEGNGRYPHTDPE